MTERLRIYNTHVQLVPTSEIPEKKLFNISHSERTFFCPWFQKFRNN